MIEQITYPYPLRSDCMIRITLPINLNKRDLERLFCFLQILAVPEADKQRDYWAEQPEIEEP